MKKLLNILSVIIATLFILLFITPIIFIWSDISLETCVKIYGTNVLLVFLFYIITDAIQTIIKNE